VDLYSLRNEPKEFKLQLLKALGLDVDEKGVFVVKDGQAVIDVYIDKPVRFDNMAIFPGSTIVIDDNPLSIASYLEEHEQIT
jgi:hypothetical protein